MDAHDDEMNTRGKAPANLAFAERLGSHYLRTKFLAQWFRSGAFNAWRTHGVLTNLVSAIQEEWNLNTLNLSSFMERPHH